jgi:hypothetical protein
MTEQEYESHADSIAVAIWETSTGNGRDLPEDLWDSHMQNCRAAVANTYADGVSLDAWHGAALARVSG